jgi:hypothetical protein
VKTDVRKPCRRNMMQLSDVFRPEPTYLCNPSPLKLIVPRFTMVSLGEQ